MNEKIYFISLGCDKNRVDAEMMCHRLESAGYGITADLPEADAAIVNTCGFISSAKEEAIENIFDMVREKEAGNIRAFSAFLYRTVSVSVLTRYTPWESVSRS